MTETERAIVEATARIQDLHDNLHDEYPEFHGNLAVAGTFVGFGLGAFVGSGMTNDQIVANVLAIVEGIRRGLSS